MALKTKADIQKRRQEIKRKGEKIEKQRARARNAARGAANAAKSVTVNVQSGVAAAAKNRSTAAVFIYIIAGLIVLYIFLNRQPKVEPAFKKLTDNFDSIWGPLTGRVK